jgi:hypothetical protein
VVLALVVGACTDAASESTSDPPSVPTTAGSVPTTASEVVDAPLSIADLPSAMDVGWKWLELDQIEMTPTDAQDPVGDIRGVTPYGPTSSSPVLGRMPDDSWLLTVPLGPCFGPNGATAEPIASFPDGYTCPEGMTGVAYGWLMASFVSRDLAGWTPVPGLMIQPFAPDDLLLSRGVARSVTVDGSPGDWMQLVDGVWVPLSHLTATLDELDAEFVRSAHTVGDATLITTSGGHEVWLTETLDASVTDPTRTPEVDRFGEVAYLASGDAWYRIDWTSADTPLMSVAREPGVWLDLGTIEGLPDEAILMRTGFFADRLLLVAFVEDTYSALFASSDGTEWAEVPLPVRPFRVDGQQEPYIGLGGINRWLQVQFQDDGYVVTPDLETWYRLEGPPRFDRSLQGYGTNVAGRMGPGAITLASSAADPTGEPRILWPALLVVAPAE